MCAAKPGNAVKNRRHVREVPSNVRAGVFDFSQKRSRNIRGPGDGAVITISNRRSSPYAK